MKHRKNLVTIVAAITAISLSGWLYAARPEATSRPTMVPRVAASRPAESACEGALSKVVSMKFREEPLYKVMAFFGNTADLNILMKWNALKAAGITETSLISIELKNVSLEAALQASLEAIDGSVPLDFTVKDDILIVTTANDAATRNMLITRVYDVTDIFSGGAPEQADSLIASIMQNIDTDSWRSTTGTVGTISYLGGALTVTQTWRNHRAVQKWLDDLRKTGVRIHSSPAAQTQQVEPRMKLVSNMESLCANSAYMGIVAIGSLRTELPQKREEIITSLATLLSETRSPALRNAIRLTLKDVYVEMGDTANALLQLKAIIRENDQPAALNKGVGKE
jgi:hypothetical protein